MTKKRNWGTSNPFSEGHRNCLPGNYCLFDIDGFLLDDSGNPCSIYEGKFKIDTKNNFNFIDNFFDRKNIQATYLRIVSYKIKVWICEESTNSWWELENSELKKSENPNLDLFDTSDRIYVEDIIKDRHKISGVFIRTEGEKPCSMETFADYVSEALNVQKILVNDIHEEGSIFFKNGDKTIKGKILESYSGDWNKEWEELDIV